MSSATGFGVNPPKRSRSTWASTSRLGRRGIAKFVVCEAGEVPATVFEARPGIAARSSVATVRKWRIFEYKSFLLPGGVDGSLDDPGVVFESLRTGSGPSYGLSGAFTTVKGLGDP